MSQHKKEEWGQLLRRLLASPFYDLPPEFGDSVPPDLEAFERRTAEIMHHQEWAIDKSLSGHKAGKRIR